MGRRSKYVFDEYGDRELTVSERIKILNKKKRKSYAKQLKKLPKKAKSSNRITKLGLKAVKVLR